MSTSGSFCSIIKTKQAQHNKTQDYYNACIIHVLLIHCIRRVYPDQPNGLPQPSQGLGLEWENDAAEADESEVR